MATVVSVDTQTLVIERYEIGGSCARKTHSCNLKELAETLPAIDSALRLVQIFRIQPDPIFAVEPPPKPTSPPAAAGEVQLREAA